MDVTCYAARRSTEDHGYEDQPQDWSSWVIEDASGRWIADLPDVSTGGATEVAEAASAVLGRPVDAALPDDDALRGTWVLTPSRAVLRRVRDSRVALDWATQAVAEAAAEERAAVQAALASGVSAVDVARILGVTRARVYQIRDGRR